MVVPHNIPFTYQATPKFVFFRYSLA